MFVTYFFQQLLLVLVRSPCNGNGHDLSMAPCSESVGTDKLSGTRVLAIATLHDFARARDS